MSEATSNSPRAEQLAGLIDTEHSGLVESIDAAVQAAHSQIAAFEEQKTILFATAVNEGDPRIDEIDKGIQCLHAFLAQVDIASEILSSSSLGASQTQVTTETSETD